MLLRLSPYRSRVGGAWQTLLGLALIALWIAATPFFAMWLNLHLQSRVPTIGLEDLPQSDVVVLLGGGSNNRIVHAFRIYRAGKAPVILISGGMLPWETGVTEAQQIADFLVELGAPRSALILENKSQTTRENAVNTAAIFKAYGWQHGILVTSGLHMPRALAAFQKAGLDMTPSASDTTGGSFSVDSVLDLLPQVNALAWTTAAIREIVGLMVYRYRNWA